MIPEEKKRRWKEDLETDKIEYVIHKQEKKINICYHSGSQA
jgi:hypothetical protein